MNALKKTLLALLGAALLSMTSCAGPGHYGTTPDYGRYLYDDAYYYAYPYPCCSPYWNGGYCWSPGGSVHEGRFGGHF